MQSFLNGGARNHVVLRAVCAHIGEIGERERVRQRGRGDDDDIMPLLRFEAQNQIGIVCDVLRQLCGTELRGVDSDGIHQRLAGRINAVANQTMGASTTDLKGSALRVRTEKEFPHWRPANIAGANEQDAHVLDPSAIELRKISYQ